MNVIDLPIQGDYEQMGHVYDERENVHRPARQPVFTNVTYIDPAWQSFNISVDEPKDGLTFWQRRALDLRITTMAPPAKPYWNTTMVTAWVAVIIGMITILGAIGALYVYTDSIAEQRGIEKGKTEVIRQQILERLAKTEEELRRTKDLKLVQAGQEAGHSNTNTGGH